MPLLNQPTELEVPAAESPALLHGGRLLNQVKDLRAGFKAVNFLYSLSFAWEGLTYVTRTQRNFRIHLVMGTLALSMAFWLKVTAFEWALLWALIGLVLFAELMNTVVELFVDMVTEGRFDLRAKAIKDMAAGAVLVTALSATACGSAIFVPRLIQLLFGV